MTIEPVQILSSADTESRIIQPYGAFGIFIRPETGNLSTGWSLHIADDETLDNSQWTPVGNNFTNTARFQSYTTVPAGFFVKLFGGTGNALAFVQYMPPPVTAGFGFRDIRFHLV